MSELLWQHAIDAVFGLPFCVCSYKELGYIKGVLDWTSFEKNTTTISPYVSKYLEDRENKNT